MRGVQLAGIAARATLALGCAACVALAVHPSSEAPAAQLRLADGSLSVSNSKAGSAVLSAANMRPGAQATGTVTITNSGTVRGDFSLSTDAIAETPGRGGAMLSASLQLSISDITQPSPVPVYAGALGSMPRRSLGSFQPGESRTYLFRSELPVTAADALQGGSVTVAYRWDATTGGETTTTTPQPPVDIKPFKLTLSGRRTWSMRSRTKPTVTASCTRTCSPRATVRVRGMRKRLKLKVRSKPMASAAGSATRFQVVLMRPAARKIRRALLARKRIAIDVKVVAVDQYRIVASGHRLIRVKR